MLAICGVYKALADFVQPGSDNNEPMIVDDDEADEETQSEGEETAVDPMVQEDIRHFEESFRGITKKYRLIDRIGEGV